MARPKKKTPAVIPNKIGRPARIDSQLEGKLCNHIIRGIGMKGACRLEQLAYSIFLRKKQTDKSFAYRVKQAEEAGRAKLIARITQNQTWQSAAWMLERKYWKEFSKRTVDPAELLAMASQKGSALDLLRDLLHPSDKTEKK